MCSSELVAQLDATLDDKLKDFRPRLHDPSDLLHAVRVAVTWLADAVSAKNVRSPGEHVFGAFNIISKIANSFILNIRVDEDEDNMSPPASNVHDCGNIIMLIAQGIYHTQNSRLLVSAHSALRAVLKAMTVTSVWPLRVLQRECESFVIACSSGRADAVFPLPLKEFAAHCGLESNIPSSSTSSLSLCLFVLSAVVDVSSIKDHSNSAFPRAFAELIGLPFFEAKFELAIFIMIKAWLMAGIDDDNVTAAILRKLLMLPSNPSDTIVTSLHTSCLDSLAHHLQSTRSLSKSPLNSSSLNCVILKDIHLLRSMLLESPLPFRANYFFLAATTNFIVFDCVDSVIAALASTLQMITPDQCDLLPFYFGQTPHLNGMTLIATSIPVPSLILQALIDFTSHFMKNSHVQQDFAIGSKRRVESRVGSSLSDAFIDAVSGKILELCQSIDSEAFRPSFHWRASMWAFSHFLESYSLDWASIHSNQPILKEYLSSVTTVLRQGELTKSATTEQLLTCSVASSLIRMCKIAGLRTNISKDCVLVLNCIFETLSKGFSSSDVNSMLAFETCAFFEILSKGGFHELFKSYVTSCVHPVFLSFCSIYNFLGFDDLLSMFQKKQHSHLVLFVAVNVFSPHMMSLSNLSYNAILSLFPIDFRDFFSARIKSQGALVSDLSVTLTKQQALRMLPVLQQMLSGFQSITDALSTAIILSCTACLLSLHPFDSISDQDINDFLTVVGEFSVKNLTGGLIYCSLLPELIAIISRFKFGPYLTVAACNQTPELSKHLAPKLAAHFTEYQQKFLLLIIDKAERNSQVSEEASQVTLQMEEAKSIIETLTLILCSMNLNDQLGAIPLDTILSFLSISDSTILQDSFSEESIDKSIESLVLWSLHTVAHAHQVEISQLIDMHKRHLYQMIADSMMSSSTSLVSFMTMRVYKCSIEELIIRMLPVLFPSILEKLQATYDVEITMPPLLKKMLSLMRKNPIDEKDERKLRSELLEVITPLLPQIMSRILFLPDEENSQSIDKLVHWLQKSPKDLLRDARAVLYSSCEYLGEALPCEVETGQDRILRVCACILDLRAQGTVGNRRGRVPQANKIHNLDEARSHFKDEMYHYIISRCGEELKFGAPLQVLNQAKALQRSIPILQKHAVTCAPKILSLISNAPLIPSSVRLDILETLISQVFSSGCAIASSSNRACAVGDWVNLRSPIESIRPRSHPQYLGPFRVVQCYKNRNGSISCCIEDTIRNSEVVVPANDLLPVDMMILKIIPKLIAEIGFLYDIEPLNVTRLLTTFLNTESFQTFLCLLPYGLDIPQLSHLDSRLYELYDRCTLKGNIYRCLPGIQSEGDRVRQLSIIELQRVLKNAKLSDLNENDFVSIFQCCIPTLLEYAHVGKPVTKISCGHCIGELGALDPQHILQNPPIKKSITLPDLAQDLLKYVFKLTIGGSFSNSDARAMSHAECACLELLNFLGCKDLALDKNNEVVSNGTDVDCIPEPEKFWMGLPTEMKKTFKQLLTTHLKFKPPIHQEASKSSREIFRSGMSMKQWKFSFVKELMIRVSAIHNGKHIMQPCMQLLKYSYELQNFLLPSVLSFLVENGQDDDRDVIYREMMAILSLGSCEVAEVDASVMNLQTNSDQSILQEVFYLMDNLSSIAMHRKYDTENRLTKFLDRFPSFTMASRSLGISAFSAALLFAEKSWREEQMKGDVKLCDPILRIMQRSLSSLEAVDDIPALFNLMRSKSIDDIAFHYESLGNWTAALPCFERGDQAIRRKSSSDSMDNDDELYSSLRTDSFADSFDSNTLKSASVDLRYDISRVHGLLNCLKQIGSFECAVSAAVHAANAFPQFASIFRARAIQSAWRQGPSGFQNISTLIKSPIDEDFDVAIGRALVALSESEFDSVQHWSCKAREVVMDPLAATSSDSYRRSYPHIIKLHMLKDLETATFELQKSGNSSVRRECMHRLLHVDWKKRLMRTQSSLRLREPILSLHRCLVEIAGCGSLVVDCWLNVAKSARKSGNLEAGHAAIIHAKRSAAKFSDLSEIDKAFILYEDSKLKWTSGCKHLALEELQNALKAFHIFPQQRDPRPESILAQCFGDKSQALSLVWRYFDWSYDIGEDLPAVQLERARPWLEKFGDKHEKSQLLLARYFDKVYMWARDIINMRSRESSRPGVVVGLSDKSANVVYTSMIDSRKIVDSATPGFQYSNPQKSTSYDAHRQLIDDSMEVHACRLLKWAMSHYISALRLRGVNVFEEISRVLSLYFHLDHEEELSKACNQPPQDKHGILLLAEVDALLHKALLDLPTWQWLCALPQLLSRLEHDIGIKTQKAKFHVRDAVAAVLYQYPERAFWRFGMIITSSSDRIKKHCSDIVSKARHRARSSGSIEREQYFADCQKNAEAVLKHLQTLSAAGQNIQQRGKDYSLDHDHINLGHLCSTEFRHLVVPSQAALSPSLSCIESGPDNAIFPSAVAKIKSIDKTVTILNSKQAPVKMALLSSEGQKVLFLLKPFSRNGHSADDYRKDAYMMDFCALLNRLLERSHDGRSRELSLRTFAVVNITQNIGMMEWVSRSQTIRNIMQKLYDEQAKIPTIKAMGEHLQKLQEPNNKKPGQESLKALKEHYCAYFDRIPLLFYKWFLQTFQSPNDWFRARLNFVRSLAVWSIVGYITGLGDRHPDNILMDLNSGSCFHVDFECLLDTGSSLTVPERVPFRLTPNLVDAMGPAGEDGAFRTCCVVTMKVLREHRTGLISVSETFTNDPLIQWNDSNKELRKENLKCRLAGVMIKGSQPLSESGQVQSLINEAKDVSNLCRMYHGWSPWM